MSGAGFTSYPLNKRQWHQHSIDQAFTDPIHKCEEDWFGKCYGCGRNMLDQAGGEDHATSLDNALDD